MTSVESIGSALAACRGRIERVDARILLAEVLGRPASYLVAYPEAPLTAEQQHRFVDWVARREQGEPVAYLVGSREFYGRRFEVSPAVLIPRPETEGLVELAKDAFPTAPRAVLDLGTGSGAIAITLALLWPDTEVMAVDRSAEALAVATRNAHQLGARVRFAQSDWFSAVPAAMRFDLIVSNPPYVAAGDPHLAEGDVRFEPASALAAGPDGLDDIRCIAAEAVRRLAPDACLLIEHGYDQAEAVSAILRRSGLQRVQSWPDLAGIPRVTGGWLDASADEA
ncbi:peptide chain release factor N(5)-glutamine methyltransferase [Denitromonas ohlonensis]|uniref:Release factor glutamine methyltransferase n=2 Tax=Denitromonas TaxID=139331 RepID=A0A557SMI6_9RHOO|nr:peptide chain release factor N(5)-glutamine methyltransferase [Denitromonas ohlonensis]TVO60357.1 peptide chain release factor N(5)-glutamine methyltransferase [Denitromonas ohlonensis]TVO78522.1 peptide chain release factor N(5)-glutamine methyltransferase [Denitromonas ohlonensis]